MESVKRYEINGTFNVPEIGQKLVNPKMVMESDFDRVTAERDALQLLLNNRDDLDDLDDQLTSLEQRRYAEQQAREAAERRVDDLKGLLCRAKPYIPWSNFGSVPYQWNIEVQDALNPAAEAVSHE